MTLQALPIVMAFMAGMGLGLFYFGGLWLTVVRLSTTQHPFRFLFSSFLLRLSLSIAAFYWIMGQHWERLVAAFLGFLLWRTILLNRVQRQSIAHEKIEDMTG